MKVFTGSVATETNTFSPMPTGLADFNIIRPADVTPEMLAEASPPNIWRQRSEERGWEFVASLFAFAEPAGATVRAAYESLRDELLDDLKKAMPVDIVLLDLHGAMVAEGYDDCEGDIIARVREIIGPKGLIGVELDPHCHLTQLMVDKADAIICYKEYPHTDGAARAEELFKIVVDTAEGKVKPTMALFDCRMVSFYLTPFQPMRGFVDYMMGLEGKDGVLSVSLAHCFPWGDVPDMGTRTLVITDNNPEKAAALAKEIGMKLFDMRHEIPFPSLPLKEGLDKALAASGSPVVIADQADNPGGGAPSDSTFILKELLDRGVGNVATAAYWDPIVVSVVKSAGVGAKLNIRLGGKMGPASGDPLDLAVIVTAITPDMHQTLDFEGRTYRVSMGDSVALKTANDVDIVVVSKRVQVLSPTCFSAVGIDPTKKRLVVVKSTQHFYAGFSPIAAEVIYIAGPGAIAPLFKEIPYQRIDRNKWPFVENPFGN